MRKYTSQNSYKTWSICSVQLLVQCKVNSNPWNMNLSLRRKMKRNWALVVQLPSKGVRKFTIIVDKCGLVKYSTNSSRKVTNCLQLFLAIVAKTFVIKHVYCLFHVIYLPLTSFVWIFVASLQALVEGCSLSSKAWLGRRPSPLMTSILCWTRWKSISLVMTFFWLSSRCILSIQSCTCTFGLKVVPWLKNHFLFSSNFESVFAKHPTHVAKFFALCFIWRLFILSGSFGFHGPPLLTFKTDRLDIRGLHLEKMTSFTHKLNISACKRNLLYMQNTGLKVWKPETPVLHINSAVFTRIAILN